MAKKKTLTDKAAEASRKIEKRLAEKDARIDTLLADLERERSRKVVTFGAARRRKKTGSFTRVTFGDTHGMRVDQRAFGAMLGDLEVIQPAEVIGMGDHLDCDGFLSTHKAIGYKPLSEYSFAEDCDAANGQFDAIDRACPGARKDYIEGNHETRIRSWILDNSQTDRDRAFHEERYMPSAVLSLPKRGWEWRSRGEQHDGLSKRGTIKRGKCFFVHGDSHAANAAKVHLDDLAGCVVFGHTHRHEAMLKHKENTGTIGAWNPGCLCERHPMYAHSKETGWTHGYGLQFVERGGAFLHLNVPIIDGRSLLSAMLAVLRPN